MRGGATISPRWPRADGREQIHDAAADVLADGLHLDALLRIERREVVEEDLVARLLGRLEVDGLDLDQREILFALVRRADVAADGVAGLEVELANLGRRHVDVVRPGQIVVVRRAEEAVAVGQNFKDALGEDVALFFALCLENLEDKVLLAESARARNLKRARNAAQFRNVFFFEFGDGHFLPAVGCDGRGVARKEVTDGEELLGKVVSQELVSQGVCKGGVKVKQAALMLRGAAEWRTGRAL